MAVNLVITRNVSNRIRGLLASSMLEVSPGVYVSPRQSPAVRQRIWSNLEEWFEVEQDASIVLLWQESSMPGGLAVKRLGLPPLDLVELDGMLVSRRPSRETTAEHSND